MKTESVFVLAVTAFLWLKWAQDNADKNQQEDLLDTAKTKADEMQKMIDGSYPVDEMTTSAQMLQVLKRRERLRLTRYELGDGGYTWGYGHWSRKPDALPMTITADQAEEIFADDVKNRGEKWVKLYVKVDLSQNEFDALVSIAFNLSPQSFKKFAASVNRGLGIRSIAQESIAWAGAQFKNGITNRRTEEVRIYETGQYV